VENLRQGGNKGRRVQCLKGLGGLPPLELVILRVDGQGFFDIFPGGGFVIQRGGKASLLKNPLTTERMLQARWLARRGGFGHDSGLNIGEFLAADFNIRTQIAGIQLVIRNR